MSVKRKLLKVSSLFILFSMSMLHIAAITPKHSKSSKNKPKQSAVTTKKVKVEQSSHHNIAVTTSDGESVTLPKVKQKLVDNSLLSASVSGDLMADASFSKSLASLQQRLIEKKEMEELSSLLGVTIADVTLLPLYREAADWLGTRYRRGGMSRKAVDCSGFTNIIYKNVFGIQLDRVSTAIAKNVTESIAKEDLLPGDMVFFSTFNKKYINHVGVYIGDGKFIHASIKHGVIVSTLSEGYYSKAWRKGGRI